MVWLERRATYKRTTKPFDQTSPPSIQRWEKVTPMLGSQYLNSYARTDAELARVAMENFGGDLSETERAAVQAIHDEERALHG